jgi:polyisoprenoid-binding protein YceI
MIQKTVIILLFSIISNMLPAQQPFVVRLKDSSKLTIHGSTNINTFSFQQTGDRIHQKEVILTSQRKGNRIETGKHQIGLEVKSFKSEDRVAQIAFYRMMKTDRFPQLYIRLTQFDTMGTKAGQVHGKAMVDITITGITRAYEIPVTTERSQQNWRFTGKKKLTIKDFGLIPPEAMFGLLKVSEWIEIDIDLYCEVQGTHTIANN